MLPSDLNPSLVALTSRLRTRSCRIRKWIVNYRAPPNNNIQSDKSFMCCSPIREREVVFVQAWVGIAFRRHTPLTEPSDNPNGKWNLNNWGRKIDRLDLPFRLKGERNKRRKAQTTYQTVCEKHENPNLNRQRIEEREEFRLLSLRDLSTDNLRLRYRLRKREIMYSR